MLGLYFETGGSFQTTTSNEYTSESNANKLSLSLASNEETIVEATDETDYLEIYSEQSNEYPAVMESSSGEYALYMYDQLIPAELTEVSLGNETEMEQIISDEELPIEVRESIQENYEKSLDMGLENNIQMGLFETVDLEYSNGDVEVKENPEEQSIITDTINSSPSAAGSPSKLKFGTYIYGSYNNVSMKSYRVYYTNITIPYTTISIGTSVAPLIMNSTSIALSVVSATVGSVVVATGATIAGIAISLGSMFPSGYVTGSTSDYCQLSMTYNKIDQWTYANLGSGWAFGLKSQAILVHGCNWVEYFYSPELRTGKTFYHNLSCSNYLLSPHFNNPWAFAYQKAISGYSWNEDVSAKYGSKTFVY